MLIIEEYITIFIFFLVSLQCPNPHFFTNVVFRINIVSISKSIYVLLRLFCPLLLKVLLLKINRFWHTNKIKDITQAWKVNKWVWEMSRNCRVLALIHILNMRAKKCLTHVLGSKSVDVQYWRTAYSWSACAAAIAHEDMFRHTQQYTSTNRNPHSWKSLVNFDKFDSFHFYLPREEIVCYRCVLRGC